MEGNGHDASFLSLAVDFRRGTVHDSLGKGPSYFYKSLEAGVVSSVFEVPYEGCHRFFVYENRSCPVNGTGSYHAVLTKMRHRGSGFKGSSAAGADR